MGVSKVSRMQGEPGHLEKMVRAEGDDRRHRSRCVFYDKKNKHCSKTSARCYDAAHCSYYSEEAEGNRTVSYEQSYVALGSGAEILAQKEIIKKLCCTGTRCRHTLFGDGTVTEVSGDTVTVRFDSGMEKKMAADYVVQKKLITLL